MIYRIIHIPKDSATNVNLRPHRHNNNDTKEMLRPDEVAFCPALLCLHAFNYVRHRFGAHGDGRSICVVIIRLPDCECRHVYVLLSLELRFRPATIDAVLVWRVGLLLWGKAWCVCCCGHGVHAVGVKRVSARGSFTRPLRTVDLYA